MPKWVRVANVSDCPPGQGRELVAGGRVIALFNVHDSFFAIDGVCPHQGGPLGQGYVEGHIVTCPWHGWQFDLKSGQHQINELLQQPCFEVKVDGCDIFVEISDVRDDAS